MSVDFNKIPRFGYMGWMHVDGQREQTVKEVPVQLILWGGV